MSMNLLSKIGLVALGSSIGGLARWAVSVLAYRSFGSNFPWGTLLVNTVGCLFIGWFSAFLKQRLASGEGVWLSADDLRLLLAVGFVGAFTTFSTFEYEAHGMIKDDQTLKGMLYVCGSVVLGFLCVRWGELLANWK